VLGERPDLLKLAIERRSAAGEIASRPRKTRFCSDERGRLGLRRGVGFDFGGEDGQH
jgi:hypothetical protein